jgi:hypothetical protein
MSNKRKTRGTGSLERIVGPLDEINKCPYLSGNNLAITACILLNVFCLQRTDVVAQVREFAFAIKISPQLSVITPQVLDIRRVGLGNVAILSLPNGTKPSPKKSPKVIFSISGLTAGGQEVADNGNHDSAGEKGAYHGHRFLTHILVSFLSGAILAL